MGGVVLAKIIEAQVLRFAMGGDAAFDAICQKWNWAKSEEAAMKKTVEQCKTAIEKMLLDRKTDMIGTDSYEVKKSSQTREFLSKKDVPVNIWTQYAKSSTFSVLALKPLKSSKAKAKAKAKAAKAKAKAKGTKK